MWAYPLRQINNWILCLFLRVFSISASSAFNCLLSHFNDWRWRCRCHQNPPLWHSQFVWLSVRLLRPPPSGMYGTLLIACRFTIVHTYIPSTSVHTLMLVNAAQSLFKLVLVYPLSYSLSATSGRVQGNRPATPVYTFKTKSLTGQLHYKCHNCLLVLRILLSEFAANIYIYIYICEWLLLIRVCWCFIGLFPKKIFIQHEGSESVYEYQLNWICLHLMPALKQNPELKVCWRYKRRTNIC